MITASVLQELRNSGWTYLYKIAFKFHWFFFLWERGIHSRKYVNFARRENKKVLSISAHLLRKRFYFLTNLWWFWSICTKQCHHSKECVSVESLEATIKRFRKTDRKTFLPESILNNLNFTKNGFHHILFSANCLNVFKKRRTAAL